MESLKGEDGLALTDTGKSHGFVELVEFQGWRLAPCGPETPAREAIFYRDAKICRIEIADQFAQPVEIAPPPSCMTIHLIVRRGDFLLAAYDSNEGKRLAWRRQSGDDDRWRISPPKDELDTAIADLAIDPQGRMIGTKRTGDSVVYYQEVSEGEIKEFRYPVAIESRFSGHNMIRPVVSGGAIWIFEDVVGGATNIRRLDGALRFCDGKIEHFDLPVDLHITAAVPVAEDLLMIGVIKGDSFFWDSKKGEVASDGPFDLKPFQYQPVSRWSRAADGTVWMSTFSQYYAAGHDKEIKADRFGQIWRWNKSKLRLIQDGYDGKKGFFNDANPLLAISEDEVFAGCCYGGCFRVLKQESQYLNWRHGLRLDDVRQVRVGKDFVLIADALHRYDMLRLKTRDLVRPLKNADFTEHRAFHEIARDPSGKAWTIVRGDPPRFAFWKDGSWHPTIPTPEPTDRLWRIAVDGLGRPWAFRNDRDLPVWVYDDNRWRQYENKLAAYRDQLARSDKSFRFEFLNHFRHHCPVAVGRDKIWLVDHGESVLRILHDGQWWAGPCSHVGDRMSPFRSRPYLNAEGAPRIVQGKKVFRFDGTTLVEVDEKPPPATPAHYYDKLTEMQRNSRFRRAKSIKRWAQADDGVHWAVTSRGEMYGFTDEVVETVSLRGTPLWSRTPRAVAVASDGTLFINAGPGRRDHIDHWVAFEFTMPRVDFAANVETSENAMTVVLKRLNFPQGELTVLTRLDEGPWQSALKFVNVPEGKHTVEVRCRLKDRLSTSKPQTLNVQVTGNLREKIATLIRRLGDDNFHIREDATKQLLVIGQHAAAQLETFKDDSDSEVRFRVRRILAVINAN